MKKVIALAARIGVSKSPSLLGSSPTWWNWYIYIFTVERANKIEKGMDSSRALEGTYFSKLMVMKSHDQMHFIIQMMAKVTILIISL